MPMMAKMVAKKKTVKKIQSVLNLTNLKAD